MLVAQHFETAGIEQGIDIGKAEIDQVAGDVDAVPLLAQQQELPAGGVGDLNDQATVGAQQLMCGVQIAGRVVQMFEDVKHRHGGTTAGCQGSFRQCCADGGDTGPAPGDIGRIERKVQADDILCSSLGQHLKEQSAAAADVQHEARFFRFAQRALDETKMIAQYEAAVNLFQAIGGVGVGGVPIAGRIIIAQFQRMRLRIEADQPAVAALDDAENLVRGSVQPVGAGKQQAGFAVAAGGAGIGRGDGTRSYVAFSESSRRGIRYRNNRRRTCFGLRRCLDRNALRLRSIDGIIGNADSVPLISAMAAVSLPRGPW